MADHAQNSPSSFERWGACAGSQALSAGLEQKESAYASEGTAAHALAEAMLKGQPSVGKAEMRDAIRVYVDHVRELAAAPGAVLHIEKQVHVTPTCWGTADAIVWVPGTRTLHVIDLKYGTGIGVEVRGNAQLKIYALGALLTMKYPAQVVNVGICQPRYTHPDGPIRSVDYDVVDLLDFHADLLDAEERVYMASIATPEGRSAQSWQDTYLHPSEKGCRWCLASPHCPKVQSRARELAAQVFAVATADNAGVRSYDPQELAKALDFLPILEGWIKNVREFGYAEAEAGHAIPGYKLVEKRATRKWNGDEEVIAAEIEYQGVIAWKKTLIGVTEAEKALGKGHCDIIDRNTIKESSGHTLVHESDKRPAVSLDAQSVFDILS